MLLEHDDQAERYKPTDWKHVDDQKYNHFLHSTFMKRSAEH